jgi:serine/threonine protein kinase/tetratricopeptide (TPR) repeat protein
MSDFETSNDSSGNLAASQPTVPDFTVDGGRAAVPDPEDTQQDPMAVRRAQQNQNVTNDPLRHQVSQQNTSADTMEDPLGNRAQSVSNHQNSNNQKVWLDPLAPDDTMEDPLVAGKKVWADPLAQDDTVADAHGSGRKVYPDPLAPDGTVADAHGSGRKIYPDPLAVDATQQEFGSARGRQSGASGESTNWDPVNGSSPAPPITPPPQAKKNSGHGFSEGDLFARKYEIKGHIGQGGMGVVYKALDLVLGRTVAIKFLKGKSGISQIEMSRFQQEAKAIASLNHSNIIRVHDMSVTDEGDPFFVLEYIEGHALSNEIRGKKQLPLERALDIISQVCDALQHAHEHGVIHRDIKPSNLMIVPQPNGTEVVKLLDFGIAKLSPIDEQTLLKLTKTGELFGSPHYMSPEQCSGESIEATTDIYSLGCVLYELICGVPPFSGSNAIETLDKHKNASLKSVTEMRKDLAEGKLLDILLNQMMAKEPSARLQTPREVKSSIQEILRRRNGGIFQRTFKQVCSHGSNAIRGRKFAALVFFCILLASGGAFVVSRLMDNSVRVAPNLVPPTKHLLTWNTYDLKGQRLFDSGAYRAAEKQFLLGVEKAKSEVGARRNLHLYTSLQELKMLYYVLNDTTGIDRVEGELVECEVPAANKSSNYSWDDLLESSRSARTSQDFNRIAEQSAELMLNGNSISNKQNKRLALESIAKKCAGIDAAKSAVLQLNLLSAYLEMTEGGAILKQGASSAFSELTKRQPEELPPPVACVLITLGCSEPDPGVVESFADYGSRFFKSAMYKFHAQSRLAEIYSLTGRKDAAIQAMEYCLQSAESEVPRNYWHVAIALKSRADLFADERNFKASIPLLVRADSIIECTPSFRNLRMVSSSESIKAALANAYTGVQKYGKAEQILTELLEKNSSLAPLFKAELLYKLSIVYSLTGRSKKAENSLEESIALFGENPTNSSLVRTQFVGAVGLLKRIRE